MRGWTASWRDTRGRGNPKSVARWHGARVGDQPRDLGNLGTDPVVADLVIDALATWRIVRFIQRDSLIEEPREELINRYGHLKISELLTCPWCLSPHAAMLVLLGRRFAPKTTAMIVRALAYSAVTGVLTGVVDKLEE